MKPTDDVIRVHHDPTEIDAAAWDALLECQSHPTPFMRMAYLAALHSSGSAVDATGWSARFLTVHRAGQLIAAAPAYLKRHSYGEYVFDWAWADAYHRHGLRYYPKLLVAVPFTPVPGSRLLALDAASRWSLTRAIGQLARDAKASSVHLLFPTEEDLAAAERAAWMHRQGVQFHWTRDAAQPATDFAGFLASLQREKRKKIMQERRRVAEAGITFTEHRGTEITDDLWDYFHRCYELTYQAHRSTPYLSRGFFTAMARDMPEHWLMFVARRGTTPVGVSLIAIDASRGAAWGRYWGCTEHVPCLHFEACYYQPLAWCIAQGFQRFEGGAQGEHKMARGLLPVATHSAHWLAHPEFAQAVQAFLAQEGTGMAEYMDELKEHSPFKND